MSRPRKKRCIKGKPKYKKFGPKGTPGLEEIELKLDEYESIRLMDIEELTQEECASKMSIGRSTFQRIYKNARRKLAESVINNKDLIFSNQEENIIIRKNGKDCQRRIKDEDND
ncbi:MAG TPA: DUF134 domain-containing protein [Clostridia bacterium]|nr:DUF134 domain-containing protein [Clostridia bacterium]